MLYGAFIGDMIGVPYEFISNKNKDVSLWTSHTRFSDDSVMTMAVADAVLKTMNQSEDSVKISVVRSMRHYGAMYPFAGYGNGFKTWLRRTDPKPYNSYGNGSAMRVSSVGWLYNDLDKVEEVAKWTAEVTHNHPEGIKGAQATAAAIYLARMGKSKEYIKQYITDKYGYNLDRTCDEIRPNYQFNETCQETVPEAIICFLDGKDFEDVIRNAISLGGDADTAACIAGSIAEGYFSIPEDWIDLCNERLDQNFRDILRKCFAYVNNK